MRLFGELDERYERSTRGMAHNGVLHGEDKRQNGFISCSQPTEILFVSNSLEITTFSENIQIINGIRDK